MTAAARYGQEIAADYRAYDRERRAACPRADALEREISGRLDVHPALWPRNLRLYGPVVHEQWWVMERALDSRRDVSEGAERLARAALDLVQDS